MDDNRYIDYRLGFGPIILGHADPLVAEKVTVAMASGNVFAATTPAEIELAERFTRMTETDMVRLANSGTEATMHALRIARAYTGRERFVKFDGQYHGMYDYVLYNTPSIPAEELGPRRKPLRISSSEGIPDDIDSYLILAGVSFVSYRLSEICGTLVVFGIGRGVREVYVCWCAMSN